MKLDDNLTKIILTVLAIVYFGDIGPVISASLGQLFR